MIRSLAQEARTRWKRRWLSAKAGWVGWFVAVFGMSPPGLTLQAPPADHGLRIGHPIGAAAP